MKLNEIGEKKLVKNLTSLYTQSPCLVGGFGHDSAILDIALSSDEYPLGDIIDCDEQMNLKTDLEDKTGVINYGKKAVQ